MTDFVVCGGGRGWWLNMILSYPARKGEGEALIYIGGWLGGGGCWLNIISSKAYLVLFLSFLFTMKADHSRTKPAKKA